MTYHTDAAHFLPDHVCDGACPTLTVAVEPGWIVTYDETMPYASELETLALAAGLQPTGD